MSENTELNTKIIFKMEVLSFIAKYFVSHLFKSRGLVVPPTNSGGKKPELGPPTPTCGGNIYSSFRKLMICTALKDMLMSWLLGKFSCFDIF